MCVTFNSCNKGAGSGEAAAASEEPVEAFENAVTYENAQYGFQCATSFRLRTSKQR